MTWFEVSRGRRNCFPPSVTTLRYVRTGDSDAPNSDSPTGRLVGETDVDLEGVAAIARQQSSTSVEKKLRSRHWCSRFHRSETRPGDQAPAAERQNDSDRATPSGVLQVLVTHHHHPRPTDHLFFVALPQHNFLTSAGT